MGHPTIYARKGCSEYSRVFNICKESCDDVNCGSLDRQVLAESMRSRYILFLSFLNPKWFARGITSSGFWKGDSNALCCCRWAVRMVPASGCRGAGAGSIHSDGKQTGARRGRRRGVSAARRTSRLVWSAPVSGAGLATQAINRGRQTASLPARIQHHPHRLPWDEHP